MELLYQIRSFSASSLYLQITFVSLFYCATCLFRSFTICGLVLGNGSCISGPFVSILPQTQRPPCQPPACSSAAALGNLAMMCWHMADDHCCINACSVCMWQVRCWVCPPVVRLGFYILHPRSISLQVPALYGVAAALRRVIGYWADCFACGPFFRPVVVSFFFSQSPPPHPPPFPLSFYSLVWMHSTHTG